MRTWKSNYKIKSLFFKPSRGLIYIYAKPMNKDNSGVKAEKGVGGGRRGHCRKKGGHL